MEAVLRLPAAYPEKEECLRTCLLQLASTYSLERNWNFLGEPFCRVLRMLASFILSFFSVTVTGNVVLKSEDRQAFTVYYGQDYAQRRGDLEADLDSSNAVLVDGLQDLRKINFTYDLNDFESLHADVFKNLGSDVSIESLISVVYTVRANLTDSDSLLPKGKIYGWKLDSNSSPLRSPVRHKKPSRSSLFESSRD